MQRTREVVRARANLFNQIAESMNRVRGLLQGMPRNLNYDLTQRVSGHVEVYLGEPFDIGCWIYYGIGRWYMVNSFHGVKPKIVGVHINVFNGMLSLGTIILDKDYGIDSMDYLVDSSHIFYTLLSPKFIKHLRRHGFTVKSEKPEIATHINRLIETGIDISNEVMKKLTVDVARNILSRDPPQSIEVHLYVARRRKHSSSQVEILVEDLGGQQPRIWIRTFGKRYKKITPLSLSNGKTFSGNPIPPEALEALQKTPIYINGHVVPYIRDYLMGYAITNIAAQYLLSQ